jgi:RluA family pseudouridine synthase
MEIPRHPEFEHLELLEYLALLWPDRSQRAIRELFARGRIRCCNRPVGMSRVVGELEDLTLAGSLEEVERIPFGYPECQPVGTPERPQDPDVLFEDHRLAVLRKPSGMPVVPDRRGTTESCLGFLIRRELGARQGKPPREFLRYRTVHRIDRLTSGLVLFARTGEVERRLAQDFELRRVHKEYLALLAGTVEAGRFTVNCPVVSGRKGKMRAEVPRAMGRSWRERTAVTRFDILERLGPFTLVRAVPTTGRTHQIRVHAYAAGYPLAIDPLYHRRGGQGVEKLLLEHIQRLTLHALRYKLPSDWEAPREFECPLPKDFQVALEALRG